METQLLQTTFGQFWCYQNEKMGRALATQKDLQAFYPGVTGEFIHKGDICLDIGANVGTFSIHAAQLIGLEGRVFAFEPCLETRDLLTKNLQINGVGDRVTVQANVVSDGIYSHSIKPLPKNMGATRFLEMEGLDEDTFQSTTLDLWLKEHPDIQKCDFIKIDVEGMEIKVLQGADNLLAEYKPILYIEVYHMSYINYGFTVDQLEELLKQYGYHFFRVFAPFPFRQQTFRRLVSLSQGCPFYNLLAIHPDNPSYPTQNSQSYQAFIFMIAEKFEIQWTKVRDKVRLRSRLKKWLEKS
jgi:FkbM family methyltransferase